MKKFFKLKIGIVILLLLFPIIFILIFKLCIKYLPGEMIGSIDGWLGFLGGYLGVLGALGAIFLQSYEEKRKKIENTKLYVNFILNYNLKKINANIQSELIDLFDIETKIDTISNQYNYFLNFNEEEIQNNLSTYIDLKIIEPVYKITSSIKCFSNHYNYCLKNCNSFHNDFATLKKRLKLKNELLEKKFDIIYNNVKKLSKINYFYNSIRYEEYSKNKLLFLKPLQDQIKKNCDDLKKFSSYYEYKKINNIFYILEEINKKILDKKMDDITLDFNIVSDLFEAYKESLEILLLFLEDNRLLKSKNFRKYKLMLFSINITYDTFCSLKKEIEELKKSF